MERGWTEDQEAAHTALIIDSDPDFLKSTCELISSDGHRAWGAGDLGAALSFLAKQKVDTMLVELALLGSERSDSLSDLRKHAPAAPMILTGPGAPGEQLGAVRLTQDIYGYHDKGHGAEVLLVSVNAALKTARHIDLSRKTRQGLRYVLQAVPHLYRIGSLEDVLQGILWQIEGLLGGESSFVAAGVSKPAGTPDVEGFIAFPRSSDDYVVRAATGPYRSGVAVSELDPMLSQLIRRAVQERRYIIDERCSILPLALGDRILGVIYLDRPPLAAHDMELLLVFASQAAAAIQNATLYELATVDSTTQAFLKAFALERLGEALKLARRQAFPVSVLMLDIDGFKQLNDEHGHLTGDRVLRHLADALKSAVRNSDVVGRFGGDEFLVVLPDADLAGAGVVVERLQRALAEERAPLPDGVPPFQVSTGVASLAPSDQASREMHIASFETVVESLVAEADAAMYRAKREGTAVAVQPTLTWSRFASRFEGGRSDPGKEQAH